MELLTALRRSGGIEALASNVDEPSARVLAAVSAMLPTLLSRLRATDGGVNKTAPELRAMLGRITEHGGINLAAEIMAISPTSAAPGMDILHDLIGGEAPDVWLAEMASDQAGVDHDLMQKIAPLLAMLVCGYISAKLADASDGDDEGLLRQFDQLMIGDRDSKTGPAGE